MAKIYGLFGSMTGKLADTVMSVRNGEQLARKYQPVVFNPSTPAQVAQRAKLKLMSQLSAIVGKYIVFPRVGPVSSRNAFTKANFGLTTFDHNEAGINLNNLQLTDSPVVFNYVGLTRGADSITAQVSDFAADPLTRVVFVFLIKDASENLRVIDTKVATQKDQLGYFNADTALRNESVVVLAYGMWDRTDSARAIFGNLEAPTASQIATLAVSRGVTARDVEFTKTSGSTLDATSQASVSPSSINNSSRKK